MSIGIIRAGPWASSSNSFLPQPDPLNVTILPVNCANHYADFWPWICVSRYEDTLVGEVFEIEPAVDGIVSMQKEARLTYDPALHVMWRYQSMNQHTLTVSYFAGFVDVADVIAVSFSVDGTTFFVDAQENVLFMGGTESITLPPATVPKQVVLTLFAENNNVSTDPGIFQFFIYLDPLP